MNEFGSNYTWTNKNNATYLIRKFIYVTSASVKRRAMLGLNLTLRAFFIQIGGLKGIFDPIDGRRTFLSHF